jgi:hypothetical protein
MFTTRLACRMSVDDSMGAYVQGSRVRKSKMPCCDGSVPVVNVDHATGDIDGCDVSSGRNTPLEANFSKFGMRPSRMNLVASPGSMPSMPMMMTRVARACLKGFPTRSQRYSTVNGQSRIESTASEIAASIASSEPANANPAPGPMYDSADVGHASATQKSHRPHTRGVEQNQRFGRGRRRMSSDFYPGSVASRHRDPAHPAPRTCVAFPYQGPHRA